MNDVIPFHAEKKQNPVTPQPDLPPEVVEAITRALNSDLKSVVVIGDVNGLVRVIGSHDPDHSAALMMRGQHRICDGLFGANSEHIGKNDACAKWV